MGNVQGISPHHPGLHLNILDELGLSIFRSSFICFRVPSVRFFGAVWQMAERSIVIPEGVGQLNGPISTFLFASFAPPNRHQKAMAGNSQLKIN
jgi:hypothetical protein